MEPRIGLFSTLLTRECVRAGPELSDSTIIRIASALWYKEEIQGRISAVRAHKLPLLYNFSTMYVVIMGNYSSRRIFLLMLLSSDF